MTTATFMNNILLFPKLSYKNIVGDNIVDGHYFVRSPLLVTIVLVQFYISQDGWYYIILFTNAFRVCFYWVELLLQIIIRQVYT